jgi:hypothetical protein
MAAFQRIHGSGRRQRNLLTHWSIDVPNLIAEPNTVVTRDAKDYVAASNVDCFSLAQGVLTSF